jgi:hypothetical protein
LRSSPSALGGETAEEDAPARLLARNDRSALPKGIDDEAKLLVERGTGADAKAEESAATL